MIGYNKNVIRCDSCGSPDIISGKCSYCGSLYNHNQSKPNTKKRVIKSDMGKFSYLEDVILKGDMNKVEKAKNCEIRGDMNKLVEECIVVK